MITPTASLAPCPLQLDAAQIDQYRRNGFIAFTDVLSAEEIEQAKAGLNDLVEKLRPFHRELTNDYGVVWSGPGGVHAQFQRVHEPLGSDDPAAAEKVRKFAGFVGFEPLLSRLANEHPLIRGVLGSLIGAESILSQDMALMNPPGRGTGKPWHQDDAYFKVVPLDAVCGVWIALDPVSPENGCMNFLPGWHQRGALRHYHGSDCEIFPERLDGMESESVAVPLPAGGAVFFIGTAPHMTKPNTSTLHRRSLQFHYRSLDSRLVSEEEYDAIFVETDGTAASCSAAARRGF